MKAHFVKVSLILTLGHLTALANPVQTETTALLASGATTVTKIPEAENESNPKTANLTEQEYLVSKITLPSLDDACTIDDIFNVKLILLDNEKGELRLYDGDANLLGSEQVVFAENERTGREVKNRLAGKTKDSKIIAPANPEKKRVAYLNQQVDIKNVMPAEREKKHISDSDPVLLNRKTINPSQDFEHYATDPVITFQTEDKNGTDNVSFCIARNSDFIIAQQSLANKTCLNKVLNITCPDIDVFTSILLKARCDFKRSSVERNFFEN